MEYIQIWDTDLNSLILESLTMEKSLWFAKPKWISMCERKVDYERGKIKFRKLICEGETDGFDLVNDTIE